MSPERAIFNTHFLACAQRISKLKASLEKSQAWLPVDIDTLARLTETQEESIDALILRYNQCVSLIQDQIFRGIAMIEQEDIQDKTNRDKALLMEKIGVITSADAFGSAALLRNKFSHHYPEDAQDQVDKINLVYSETQHVLQIFEHIRAFVFARGYIPQAD